MASWQSARGRLAYLKSQHVSDDDERVLTARRELREGRLAEHIKRVVDEAPPLTQEQRDRLALALHGPAAGDAA